MRLKRLFHNLITYLLNLNFPNSAFGKKNVSQYFANFIFKFLREHVVGSDNFI
jgi:hypothetical protein